MAHENTRQRVLIVITKSNLGGAQRYVLDLATNLPRERYAVTVALGGTGEADAQPGPLYTKLREADIATIFITRFMRELSLTREFGAFFELFRIIKEVRPDILHVNSSKAGALGALAGRLLRVKCIVFTAHGWEFNNPARGMFPRGLFACAAWATMLLAHATIAPSHELKRQAHFPFAARRIRVVHHGLTVHKPWTREEARRRLLDALPATTRTTFDNEHALWVGTIAELHPVKGLTFALAAIAALAPDFPHLRYIIIGEGELRHELTRRIRELNLADRVVLAGYKEQARVYLPAFDVFLFPSLSEALGYVLLEAGAAGLPVVATDVGGIPDVIEDRTNGLLVPPGNPAALAKALESLLREANTRKRFGEALHRKITSDFTLVRMIEDTRAVYDAVHK